MMTLKNTVPCRSSNKSPVKPTYATVTLSFPFPFGIFIKMNFRMPTTCITDLI